MLALGVLALAALIFRMHWFERRDFKVSRHAVTLRKKTAALLSILYLWDIHFAFPERELALFFECLAAETYDLIVLSGDIIDCAEGIELAAQTLKQLKARQGFFAVFGNHDYYDYDLKDLFFRNFPGQPKPRQVNPSGVLKEALEKIGIQVLANETRAVSIGGSALLIHGLDDPLLKKACSERIARLVPNSRLHLIKGLGHDLPEPLAPTFAEIIHSHLG